MSFVSDPEHLAWAHQLTELTWQFSSARVLQVAQKVGVFRYLSDGSVGTGDIAEQLDIDSVMTEKVLVVCAAMGLVEREDGKWTLTDMARITLSPGAELYQGDAIEHSCNVWAEYNNLEQNLRSEGGVSWFDHDMENPWSHRAFILAMHNFTMAGRGAEMADKVDLSAKSKLLDVGGGPGTYSMALCDRYPKLGATVFDLHETLGIAKQVIKRFGFDSRIQLVEGDWNKDEFPGGFDVVLMSNILHGPDSGAQMKLEKAYKASVDGAILIVQDFLLDNDKTGPLKPALFNIHVGTFSLKEMTDHIQAAGFGNISHQQMPDDLGTTLITAEKL